MIRIAFIFSLFIFFHINSQVVTPPISPIAKISQQVGLTNIEIEYSRPSVKSRKIFGGVVPYDKIWRTGANKNTIISFDKDVSFSGNIVKKGKYSIYTIPSESGWRLILYDEIDNIYNLLVIINDGIVFLTNPDGGHKSRNPVFLLNLLTDNHGLLFVFFHYLFDAHLILMQYFFLEYHL